MSGDTITRMTGCPVANNKNSLTAGPLGPALLQDVYLLEKLSHFDREKTPPRNVHALGTGAYGTFTTTNDISKYCSAQIFSKVGQKTDIIARLSGTFTEQGEADTTRDIRGFAIKFYTSEGNWDLMTVNTPVFNVRDAKLGPDAIHAFKRDPRTGEWNRNQTLDFVATFPEGLHQTLMFFSSWGGNPISYRYMNGYSCNTFSFINADHQRFWVRFHIVSTLGVAGLTMNHAKMLAGEDPNFLSRDLREAIEHGNNPKWRLCVQIMDEKEGYQKPWTFDCTKTWDLTEYPLIEIGEIELNRNPQDHFSEVEQLAFSPANVVPGIGFSPDKLLQGRLFIYDDTQHHRLGPNFKQLPVNRPQGIQPTSTSISGQGQQDTRSRFPHYSSSTYHAPQADERYREPPIVNLGNGDFYDFPNEGSEEDYYAQPRVFFAQIKEVEQINMCENMGQVLFECSDEVVNKMMFHLNKIDPRLHNMVKKNYDDLRSGKKPKYDTQTLWEDLHKKLAA